MLNGKKTNKKGGPVVGHKKSLGIITLPGAVIWPGTSMAPVRYGTHIDQSVTTFKALLEGG